MSEPHEANLKIWLKVLGEGQISEADLANLVHLCRSIAESYLVHQRSALVHICSLNGLTVSDIALDCIAQLFARDENGRFYPCESFVASLYTNLDEIPDSELFLAFKAFVLTVTKRQLAKIYAQSDPVGARIHRNVKDCIRKSRSLTLVEDFRGYVLELADEDSLDHLAAYPVEAIERELLARAAPSAKTPKLLEELAAILREQAQYRRSLRLVDVVQILRQFYVHFSELATVEGSPFEINGLSHLDLVVIQREVRRAVQEKIISTYLLAGKVSKTEAEALARTMSDMIADWCENQELHDSFYHYLQRYLPTSESEYESTWRTKVEYLTRIAREKFAACIAENI